MSQYHSPTPPLPKFSSSVTATSWILNRLFFPRSQISEGLLRFGRLYCPQFGGVSCSFPSFETYFKFCEFQGIDASSDVFNRIQMKYVNDDEDINKYFAAFHLYDVLPAAVIIDDFGDFFDNRICQERHCNPRGRDLAMVRSLALCHNAITYANEKGSCKLLLSDTYHGDSPRLHFIYKKWIPSILTIKEGDEGGSFILKDKSSSGTQNPDRIKVAKYSIALQYLLLERIVEDQTG